MSVPFPRSFKHPVILELYNSNLQEHIAMFNSMILLNDAIDSILRRALPTFMGKLTLLFFSTLAPSSIHNFVEFFIIFMFISVPLIFFSSVPSLTDNHRKSRATDHVWWLSLVKLELPADGVSCTCSLAHGQLSLGLCYK